MSELQFLLDLMLNHKLTKSTKAAIKARLMEVEANLVPSLQVRPQSIPVVRDRNAQAPSTQALLDKHGDIPSTHPPVSPQQPVEIPAVIAQTPAAVAAIQANQAVIAQAMSSGAFSGKPIPGMNSPRKMRGPAPGAR
jgi:hypothetical protein